MVIYISWAYTVSDSNAGPGAACMNGASASRVTSKPVVYEMWIRSTGHVGGRHEGHPTAIYQRLDWLLRPVTTGDSVIIPLIKWLIDWLRYPTDLHRLGIDLHLGDVLSERTATGPWRCTLGFDIDVTIKQPIRLSGNYTTPELKKRQCKIIIPNTIKLKVRLCVSVHVFIFHFFSQKVHRILRWILQSMFVYILRVSWHSSFY